LLRLTSSVISGSTALHILDVDRAATWTPMDLDIYAPCHSALQVVAYMCRVEKYELLEHPDTYSYAAGGFDTVYRLRRGTKEIDIIQSSTRSALHPIPFFWSTHVMNYLTADSFCIAYPELTLNGKALLNPIHLLDNLHAPPSVVANITKYNARGYDFRTRTTA
ncbi:hypothetical protein FKP32DRAFT_1527238, partial [Trametes sanguinea]